MKAAPPALLLPLIAAALALSSVSTEVWSGQSYVPVEDDFIQESVRSLAAVVDREYLDPVVAKRVSYALRARLDDGRYLQTRTLESLAAMLTDDLYELTSDKHLAVSITQPTEGASTGGVGNDSRQERGRRSNFGVEHIQILRGNVGYLSITHFFRPDEAGGAIAAAMQILRHTDALIVDMRNNSGGSPGTVALFASYFIDAPKLLLFEIVPRYGLKDGYYSAADSPAPNRDGRRPLYILTSKHTFSAGEGLAFLVRERDRGEIVGERTPAPQTPGGPIQ